MIKKIIFAILAIIILSWAYFAYTVFIPYKNFTPRTIEIIKGQGVNEISANLKKQKIISSDFILKIYLWLSKNEGKIKAGTYDFKKPISIKELSTILISGIKQKNEMEIKIIEGWNIAGIANYLDNNDIVLKNDFIASAQNNEHLTEKFNFFKNTPTNISLEGYLFPDTYKIFKNADADDIIKKMLDNFDKKLTEKMRTDITEQKKTIYKIITMASIIEKEVRGEEDMKIVSGIFWDRIKNGQPLQSCATIGYILGENKKQYSFEDTLIDSPYNTYLNAGLPPGPICNPGLRAINAAIYPQFTDYNYFLSKPNGETVFSKTYTEHNLNKSKYLR
ncbi:endolytic transglycosylase MltG [Candidatus Parcubacteria bacterium]|nr:endolytic transglycosylase MltG [Candidatus Parcubacteria bacterium]